MPIDVDALGLDDGDAVATLMKRLYPLVIESAFGVASITLGTDLTFDLANPFIQEVIGDLAKRVRSVADTTKDEIRAAVRLATDEGWSVDTLASHLEELAEVRSKTRGLLIARTETAQAYSAGSVLAYKESGVVSGLEWLLGPEPCPECEPLGGKVVGLDDEFADGIKYPPAHPACTCAIAAVLKE